MGIEIQHGRRRFIQLVPVACACGTGLLSASAHAQANLLNEKDPAAAALGYVSDSSKADKAKHKDGQACHNCALYQGKATDATAACPLFAGKVVAGKGWCTAYAPGGPAKK